MNCILCSRELVDWNASGICAECVVLIENLLKVRVEERWRPVDIIGADGIIVSDRGRIARLLRPSSNGKGRLQVNLKQDGRWTLRQVSHLVLEAFVGPRPPGMDGLHANDIAGDNRLENLRWDTPSANRHDRVRNGRDHNVRKTHCPKGHEYTAENTYIAPGSNRRHCRACRQIDHERRRRVVAERLDELAGKDAG